MTAPWDDRPSPLPPGWVSPWSQPDSVASWPGEPSVEPPTAAQEAPARRRLSRRRVVVATAATTLLMGGIAGAITGGILSAEDGVQLAQVTGPVGALDASAVADALLPSVVSIQVSSFLSAGTGSGFVVDEHGHVLTNAHVVSGAARITVVTKEGAQVAARLVGIDEQEDLAVLALPDSADLPPVVLGRSAAVQVGDDVLAVGSPLGLAGTVTSGIVSAVDREVQLGESGHDARALQTDASINPGNSGGPLVDAAGRVIGVNSAIATLDSSQDESGSIGIGFAIPIDHAVEVAERLLGH